MHKCAFVLMGTLLCSSGGNASAQSAAPHVNASDEDRALIEAASERWRKSFEEGDFDSTASLFTDNAIYAANTGELLRGRSEIRTAATGWAENTAPIRERATIKLQRQLLRFEQHGSLAYELARFTMSVSPPGCLINAGYSLGVWKKQPDGQWLVDTLTVNRDRDPLENACPR